MKISKQILLITLIGFIFFASGCSKSLMQRDEAEPDSSSLGLESSLEGVEENLGEGDTSRGPDQKPGSPRDFSTAEQGAQGGSAGSLSTEPKGEDRGREGDGLLSDGGDAAPESDSGFFREENVGEGDTFSGLYEKPVSSSDFGSAEQGMPGNGSSGSFSAEPFDGDRGREGNGLLSDGGEKEKIPEPFLPRKEESMVVPLPRDEAVRRLLPYHFSANLRDIHFAFDRYDLDDNSRAILKENAAYLKSHLGAKIEIQGHCDERGSNSYNTSLGDRRAQSTKSYLVSLGVDGSRIHTISYGEERPFCFESNEECWYLNRRAYFLIAD